ncbi:hypothetical protein MTR67_007202 [Solanum verrucosum]|uniref:Reverse transcriptase/retrotransposon-derived protein RNase H-like domain-containing protein n=1 Tax=Solanum verrucosum TaxID=315347 RepID=A0AAF0PZR0_SOLVR|nr:hypothetical protein MTR67_007202 [Solanum verrucosum]
MTPTEVRSFLGLAGYYRRLTSAPVLALPEGSEGYAVYCDASGVGLGCVLMQHGYAAEDCSATLVKIADELGDPPFGQLISFSVLPLASVHFESLGGTVLLREIDRRPVNCSFPRLLIHFLQGFAYWNEGWLMSFR